MNPLDWASDLLQHITGDADKDEAEVQNDATQHATQLQDQSTASSSDLQSKSETQATDLGNEVTTQGALVETQSENQGRGLQSQAGAEAGQLTSESEASSEAMQRQAGGKSTQLQADLGALDTQTRSHVNDATGTLGADVSALHGEGNSAEGQLRGQWNGLETQGSTRVKAATAQTQALVNSKTSLVQEYQGSGQHDPGQFQKRWSELQGQVNAAERGESNLQQTEDMGGGVNAQATGTWSKITNRGQALVGSIGTLASRAWSALQTRWSALQSSAAKALADVRQQASAAVTRVKNLATAAWTKLQTLANQAWPALRDMATRAWTVLKSRGTAAWLALQAAAAAAWTALQNAANSIVTSLTSKISGIIGKINGAVGRIVQFLASAVSSLISRVRSVTGKALAFVSSTAAKVGDTLRSLGTQAWQGLKDVAERAWSGLKDVGTRAWTALKDLGARVWTGLKELGTRIWNGLQSLAKRAWDMLSKAWDWLKQKAEAAWNWAKKAWEALKSAALKAWDWIKAKARAALEWLKRKWAWLKAMISRALAWLKAKWHWLKSIVKITIRIPDITLVKLQNFKPWKFVDLDSGRLPFAKATVGTSLGPLELAAFARVQADATIGGWICPCILKNIRITLQPLISRYTGQADLHIPGTAKEDLNLTGTVGGSANLGGIVGILEGGLQGSGSALGFGSLVVSPRIVYDSGKISFSERFRLEFCIKPTISLDAFARAVATTAAPPSSGGGGKLLPPGPALPPGPMSSGSSTSAGGAAKKPAEKVLWEGRWHIGSITKQECWNLGAKLGLTFTDGVPELDVDFDAKRASIGEVLRSILEGLKPSGGGTHPSVDILTDTTASGICKCVGDDVCGGGKRYKICVRTQKDCKNAQKDVDDFCNNNGEMKEKCTRPKCYYRHSKPTCPDDCDPGNITPLDVQPVSPQSACKAVPPSGAPTVNKPAGSNDCVPSDEVVNWDVISADPDNWGVCVSSLLLSGNINIKPWPSTPTSMVTPNTANAVSGGNINNTAGSKNRWQYAIDDMADYDTAGGKGGAGPDWHSTAASEAHEWAHWNTDYKVDSVLGAAGGNWSKANNDLNALRESKSSSPSPAAAKAALQPKANARIKTFMEDVTRRWNTIIRGTDKPGKGGRGYAAGMAVLNQLITQVRNYKDKEGW